MTDLKPCPYPWTVTEHGIATEEEVETAILRLAGEDAVLAYRLEGYIATLLAALPLPETEGE